jgi:hypothetical protein
MTRKGRDSREWTHTPSILISTIRRREPATTDGGRHPEAAEQ